MIRRKTHYLVENHDASQYRNTISDNQNHFRHDRISMGWSTVDVYHTDRVDYFQNADGVSVLIDGFLTDENVRGAKDFCRQYSRLGNRLFSKLDGFFSAFVFDPNRHEFFVITDHINSQKVFCHLGKNGVVAISDTIDVFKQAHMRLNPSAVASYLSNGAVLNNQTLLRDVEILDRASIHTISAQGIRHTRYWDFNISGDLDGVAEKDLKRRMGEALIRSVEKYTDSGKAYYLSLSGGYDSSSLLAILRYELGLDRLIPFTFAHGRTKPGSDSHVAKLMADKAGYDLIRFELTVDSLADNFRHNAALFNGQGNYCDEIEFVAALSSRQDDCDGIIFGEECFGLVDDNIKTKRNAFTALNLYAMENLDPIKTVFCQDQFDLLGKQIENIFDSVLEKAPNFDNHFDLTHYLYLDQRISMIMTSWRNYYYSHVCRVANPYLDRELLEFVGRLPRHQRKNKVLFKKTVSEKYPEIFVFNRARTGSNLPNSVYESYVFSNANQFIPIFGTLCGLSQILSETDIAKIMGNLNHSRFRRHFQKLKRKFSRKIPLVGTDLDAIPLCPADFAKRFITLVLFCLCIEGKS